MGGVRVCHVNSYYKSNSKYQEDFRNGSLDVVFDHIRFTVLLPNGNVVFSTCSRHHRAIRIKTQGSIFLARGQHYKCGGFELMATTKPKAYNIVYLQL